MASKTILNQNIIDRVIDHTLKGISIESVFALSNISPRAYYYWINQGREDIDNEVESVHAQFAESILAAEAVIEQRLLDQAIGTDPIGARWMNAKNQPHKVANLCNALAGPQSSNLMKPGMIQAVGRHVVPPVKKFCGKNYFTRSSSADQLFVC